MQEPKFTAVTLPLAELEFRSDIQPRAYIDPKTVAEYAEAIKNGAIMPPLDVFAEQGSQRYLVADGFHRGPAMKANDIEEVDCRLHVGGIREAKLFAAGANGGLRRNDKDKRRSVLIVLKDPEWVGWSNVTIANKCQVSEGLVRKVREDLVLAGDIDEQDTVKTVRGGQAVERKASRAHSYNTNEPDSSKKSDTKKLTPEQKKIAKQVREADKRERKAKSLEQANRDQCLQAVAAIRAMPCDGAEAVRRWQCHDQLDEFVFCRNWLNEAIKAIQNKAAA